MIWLGDSRLWDLACCLLKSSVCVADEADPAEAWLTGKHEAREDVNKRKGSPYGGWL